MKIEPRRERKIVSPLPRKVVLEMEVWFGEHQSCAHRKRLVPFPVTSEASHS